MKNIDIDANFLKSAARNIKTAMNDTQIQTVSDKTRDFVSKVYNSTTEIIDNFLKTRAQEIQTRITDAKLYRYENVILCRANGRTSYNLEQNLNLLKESGITPKFVQYFELGENDFLTIMELCDKALVPYTSAAEKVPSEVKQKFVNDVKELYQKKNIVNKEIFANNDALLVTGDGQQIVFADWNALSYLSPEDKQNMLGFIKNWHI